MGVMFEPHCYVVFLCGVCELMIFGKGKVAVITPKMLGTSIQNALNHVIRHLGFVHFCPQLYLQNWNWPLNGLESGRVYENTGTVGYALMNIVGSRTSFVIASVRSSIH
jgi:hypothetical protein